MATEALPPDPFASDPYDASLEFPGPASGSPIEPLTDAERADIRADLADLARYQRLLEPRRFRGIVVDCQECGEQHFHEWGLLRASLQQLLDEGHMRPHEPAYAPDPARYVTWEYCRGYADGVEGALFAGPLK